MAAPDLQAIESPNFLKQCRRPYITLSYAQSLDGSIAAVRGRSLALSGPESLRLTHQLRAEHKAILVGIGTLLADDPRLSVRMAPGGHPQPIVLDSWLRTPHQSMLLRATGLIPWIVTTYSADKDRQSILEEAGARVIRLPADPSGWVDLMALMKFLTAAGVDSLMVEGGARVITSFLVQRLVDRVVITITPSLVGGPRAVERLLVPYDEDLPSRPSNQICSFPTLKDVRYEQFGEDLVIWGTLCQESD